MAAIGPFKELSTNLIELILVGIYIRLLYVLFTRDHLFSNAFYTFLIVNGFAVCFYYQFLISLFLKSLICYVSFFNIQKLPIILYLLGNETMFTEYTWLASFNLFFAIVSGTVTFLGIFCMSLNRCSLIMDLPNAKYVSFIRS